MISMEEILIQPQEDLMDMELQQLDVQHLQLMESVALVLLQKQK